MNVCVRALQLSLRKSGRHEGGIFFCAVSFLNKSVAIATLEAEAEREGEGVNWGSARDLVTIATHKGNGRNLQKYMRCYRLGGRGREKKRANEVRTISGRDKS